jgi:outer membrane protein assembly factor BamD (BamD/ComL family)
MKRLVFVLFALATATTFGQSQSSSSDEDVARRQLESGRSFARQGNYTQAMSDFRAVADTHPTSSVADNALLEMARYYLDIAGDLTEANTAVDTLLKKYPTSDSAPYAYVIAGRLALARSHQPTDLENAVAQFDRVPRLFPASDAVPRALELSGQSLWYWRRFDDALSALGRVEVEYATDPAAADAYLTAGKVQVSLGDPISAMEEMQQVRNRWPNTPKAAEALGHISLLNRLYVRAKSGPAFVLSTDAAGPTKLENVMALTLTKSGAIYYATDQGVGPAVPLDAPKPPAAVKPRGMTVDSGGNLVIVDGGVLKPMTGTKTTAFFLPRSNGVQQPLVKLQGIIQLSNGDWIVSDEDEKGLFKFSRDGKYTGIYSPSKISKLAVNAIDEVAAVDKDQKSIVIFDASGKTLTKIPLKSTTPAYELQDVQDLTYDVFGHLYVLDRAQIAVFSPYTAPAAAGARGAAAPAPPPAAGRGAAPAGMTYRLVTLFAEPEKSTTGFHKATAFAVDDSGAIFVYDDNAKRILVYR